MPLESITEITDFAMDEHQHCLSCIKSCCTEFPQCPVESCSNGCGSSLHRCKWVEHDKNTCSEALVSCTNASYGCKELFPRRVLGKHIQYCPASVIQCRFCYSRSNRAQMVECDLAYSNAMFDEKLLNIDHHHLLQESASCLEQDHVTPDLDIIVDNCSHASMRRLLQARDNSRKNRSCTLRKYQQPIFHCNGIIRRDEYAAHWKTLHIDVQLDSNERIRRCPLRSYGCTYGQNNLVPHPLGSHVDYNEENDLFLFVPATACVESEVSGMHGSYSAKIQEKKELALYGYGEEEVDEESYDVLGQLPMEILLVILGYLDSLSLWNLSQVNNYLRKVCFYLLKKRGLVYFKWEKDINSELPWTRWINSKVRYWYNGFLIKGAN